MNATARRKLGVKMTIEVFTVNQCGRVIEDRGTVCVTNGRGPIPLGHNWPPCACPRHRAGQAVTR
ncbi:hypothetical protein ACIQCD_23010 [Streptomyces sp. NPDC093250]|uniref:hypothetical protein n=1 Tax=unclassified Streptomyces TaxID=2593676 RepID=UPI003412AC2F